ncbi:MAG TPA: AsnC family transcriptional regulator [Alphaproteobacteria bacterium]|nr:AsnC family transcriptional regulator [Alphaproteobacteria bacterium]
MDKIEEKIIYELSINSRQSFSQIARKIKISKNTLQYRIKNLEKTSIVKYTLFVDWSRMGLQYTRIGLQLSNNTSVEHNKAIKFLESQENIKWLASVQGKMHIIFVYLSRDISELVQFTEDLKKNLGNNIENIHLSNLQKLHISNNNFLFNKIISPPIEISYSNIQSNTNNIEDKIISELSKNAGMTILDISRKVHLTTKTVLEKIRRLTKNKIILGYSTSLSIHKYGYSQYHIFWKAYNLDEQKIKKFISYLNSQPYTSYVVESIGGLSNIESGIIVKTQREMYEIGHEIKEKFNELIKDFDPMIIHEIHRSF